MKKPSCRDDESMKFQKSVWNCTRTCQQRFEIASSKSFLLYWRITIALIEFNNGGIYKELCQHINYKKMKFNLH